MYQKINFCIKIYLQIDFTPGIQAHNSNNFTTVSTNLIDEVMKWLKCSSFNPVDFLNPQCDAQWSMREAKTRKRRGFSVVSFRTGALLDPLHLIKVPARFKFNWINSNCLIKFRAKLRATHSQQLNPTSITVWNVSSSLLFQDYAKESRITRYE